MGANTACLSVGLSMGKSNGLQISQSRISTTKFRFVKIYADNGLQRNAFGGSLGLIFSAFIVKYLSRKQM